MSTSLLADVVYLAKPSMPVPVPLLIGFFVLVAVIGIVLFVLRRDK